MLFGRGQRPGKVIPEPLRDGSHPPRLQQLSLPVESAAGTGTPLASLEVSREVIHMFAVSAILIGIVGIVFVRRRSSRKKQQTA